MKRQKLDDHILWLENLLKDFQEVKNRGKETNSNDERAKSIADIEKITEKLETYIRNNNELLEILSPSKIEVAREIEWDDIVRPAHFEEDLEEIIETVRNHPKKS